MQDGNDGTIIHYPTNNEDTKDDIKLIDTMEPYHRKPKPVPGPDPADVSEFIRNVSRKNKIFSFQKNSTDFDLFF